MGELAEKKTGALAVSKDRLGFEEMTEQQDLIIPRAKLFQGTPTEQEQFPDAKAGQIVNSLTKERLEGLFVPVFKYTEVVKFNGRQKDENFDPAFPPGGLIWKCTSPTDSRWNEGNWGPNGEKPTAMRTLNFLSYFPGVPMPLIISFSKTSFKAGKELLSLAQFAGGNMFERRYRLGSKKAESDGNVYHVLTVALDGVSTEEEVAIARSWHNSLRGKALQVHEEAADAGFTE